MEYNDTALDDKMAQPGERRPRPPLLPPCRVCDGKASGFHYGVNTCEACKGFFRRSFTRVVEYKCASSKECSIQPRRRNNCSACRLKKCQEIGMSKNAIKTGRYSYEKKTQYIEEVKSTETLRFEPRGDARVCRSNETVVSVEVSSSVSDRCSEQDLSEHSRLSEFDLGLKYRDVDKQNPCERHAISSCQRLEGMKENGIIYMKQENHSSQHLDSICSKHVCQTFDEYRFSDVENQRIINNLLKSQDQLIEDLDAFLDEIHMKNRQKEFHQRIQREGPGSVMRRPAPKSELEIKRDEQMYKVAELMDSEFRNTISFIKAIPEWKTLAMEDQINLIKEGAAELWILGHCQCIDTELGVFTGEYDMTYQDAANIWSDVYVESVYKTSVKFSKLKLTKEELVVLKTIVLSFPDRCAMVDRESVEKVQWRMLKCLQYVCEKNGIPFNRRLVEIMNGLTFARDMTEKFKEIVKTVVCQWVIFEKFPLLKEFFNSF